MLRMPRHTGDPLGSTRRISIQGGWGHSVELASARITVSEGPDRGKRFSLTSPTIRIGTSADCDVVLSDPAVSRGHALILRREDGFAVRDLGSKNGTFVSGVRVQEAALEPGAPLRVGATTLELKATVDEYVTGPSDDAQLGELVGTSPPMRELFGLIRTLAPTTASVVIEGESGTGKEVVARTLHALSKRKGALVAFDCAASGRDLIRSELFGHGRGAFTGAEGTREGAFRRAHTGTLFLDEIGDLPLELQPVLLRVLETREVQPMGVDATHAVDVRMISATNVDLDRAVAERRFRPELLHRLRVIRLRVPPLRERREDLPLLVAHLAERLSLACRFAPDALEALAAHGWPGNVRELRNTVERAAILCQGREVRARDLDLSAGQSAAAVPAVHAPSASLSDVERDAILAALKSTGGHQAAAARILGMALSTLKRKIKDYRSQGLMP